MRRIDPLFLGLALLALGPGHARADNGPAADAEPVEAQPNAAEPRPERFDSAVMIEIEGPVTPLTKYSFGRRLEEARKRNPDLLIVRIDSPGGHLTDSLELAATLRDVDWARTVAYIPNKALSGGAMISLGADDIVLGPHGRIGDVGVIGRMGPDDPFRYVEGKILSDVVAEMRALAASKGRPPALAEAMVDKKVEVWRVRNTTTEEIDYKTEAEIEADNVGEDEQVWKRLDKVVETQEGRFLDVVGQRAVELGLARDTAEDLEDVKRLYGLERDPALLKNTWIDTLVFTLNRPWATGLLFLLGLIAMYAEFNAPGIGIGGALALLCFALFFWSHWLGGTADLLDLLLFLGGLAFIALEVFVIPGFGVAGFLGALLVVAGLLMASQRVIIPETNYDLISLRNSIATIVVAGLGFFAFVAFTRRKLASRSFLSKITLQPPEPEPTAKPPSDNGEQGEEESLPAAVSMIGMSGSAITALRPAGKANIAGRYLDVVAADGAFIGAGQPVQVVEQHGNRVIVREMDEG